MRTMKKTRVALLRQTDYKSDSLRKILEKCFSYLGGLESIIKPRSKVFVKINHLSPPSTPDKAIVTHPAFTREILILLKQLDAEITVGDDIQSKGKDGFLVSGYRQVCEELDVRLVNLKERGFRETDCTGQVLNKTYISPLLLDTDFILNLPKLKTHSFTVFTGAVKNMFGVIPHGLRHRYHREFVRSDIFSQMLVDIFACVPPHLTVMDGIIAMEGEGPGQGKPKNVGAVIASKDAVAVDAVASKIAGFNPLSIYTNQLAHERGLGVCRLEDLEILGANIQDLEDRSFKHSAMAVGILRRKIPAFLHAFIQDQLTFIPEIITKNCTSCLECVDICPVGAAQLEKDSVHIDKSLCIHCMCCHEVCRFQAIKLKQKTVGKLVDGLSALYGRITALLT